MLEVQIVCLQPSMGEGKDSVIPRWALTWQGDMAAPCYMLQAKRRGLSWTIWALENSSCAAVTEFTHPTRALARGSPFLLTLPSLPSFPSPIGPCSCQSSLSPPPALRLLVNDALPAPQPLGIKPKDFLSRVSFGPVPSCVINSLESQANGPSHLFISKDTSECVGGCLCPPTGLDCVLVQLLSEALPERLCWSRHGTLHQSASFIQLDQT